MLALLPNLHISKARLPRVVDFNRRDCADRKGVAHFFPNAFRLGPERSHASLGLDDFFRNEHSRKLQELGEPSLSCTAWQAEEYRFLSRSTMIHIVLPNDPSLPATILIDTYGSDGGWNYFQTRRVLSYDEQCDFLTLLWRADFWRLVPFEGSVFPDASTWLAEGRRGAVYHAVARFGDPLGDLGLAFLGAARLPTHPDAR